MIEELRKLVDAVEEKTPALIKAIQEEDPTSEKFSLLLKNFNDMVAIYTGVRSLLLDVAKQVEIIKGKGKDNEENSDKN